MKEIVKKAVLPPEVEKPLLEEIDKQVEVTDEFILDVANTLESVGIWFKSAGEMQEEYLNTLLAEAAKVGSVLQALKTGAEGGGAEDTK